MGESEENKILIISSYSPVKEHENHLISSFRKELAKQHIIPVVVEYMDSEAFSSVEEWKQWLLSLFQAYENPPRLVVILGGEAWYTYRKNRIDTWKNIPVVLGAVKSGYIDYEEKLEKITDIPFIAESFQDFKVTGYYLKDYVEENIRLARMLSPEIKDIAWCYDDRYDFDFFESYLLDLAHQIGDINLHYWVGSQLSTAQLVDSAIHHNYPLVSAGWYTDINRYPHAYSMLQNELNSHSQIYIYGLQDMGFNHSNYIGGYFVTGAEIGRDLAHLAYQVLRQGIENSDTFRLTPSVPKHHINYPIFQRLGVDSSLLPEDVVWHNKELSLWQKYLLEMVFVLILILLAGGLIGSIVFYQWRQKRSYAEANQRLKHLMEAMPNMAVVYNAQEQIVDLLNADENLLLDFTREKLLGLTMQEIAECSPPLREAALTIGKQVAHTTKTREVAFFNYEIITEKKEVYVDAKTIPLDEDKVICFFRDMTSWILAEKEVIRMKNFLQSIIDHLPVGVIVKDPAHDFRYIYYNRWAMEFYSHDEQYLTDKTDYEINKDQAEAYRREDIAALQSDKPFSFNRRMVDADGKERWAVVTKTHLHNSGKEPYVIVILVDVTQIRENERELEGIRNELSIALDAGSLAAWIFDVEKRIFVTLYRETLAQQGLTYETAYEMVHPEDREKYQVLMEYLISGQCERKKAILRFKRNGEYNWYETHAIGIRSAETGQVVQIIGTEKNITEELQKRQELEESKFKIEFVIKSNGIIPWDYNVKEQCFSSPDENYVYRKSLRNDFLSLVYSEDRALVEKTLDYVIQGEAETVNLQVRISFSGEEYRWVDIHAVAFAWDEQGNVSQIIGLFRDITEWKNLTEELILLRNKAEESNRLKTAFLANMSHEIRTPLNAIVGFSNLIAHTEDPQEMEEYSRIIEANNDLLLQLVNDILDLSKIEAGQLEFVYSEVNIPLVFQDLEQIYRFRVKGEVQLICELPDEQCTIQTEKNRLTQVLSNFLTNACKFTSSGSIRMGYEHLPEGLRFYVADTGKGIAPENLPSVFDRFTKFDAFVQGTGLGLSICQTIVNRLGGKIGVDSELGKGSTFWFIIPCDSTVPEKVVLPIAESAVTEILSSSGNGQKMILVAEDDDSNYFLVSRILGQDCKLQRAKNGEEAVKLAASLQPDLILMDIRMPVMDGLEATMKIREMNISVPIVALTANAFSEDREAALAAGCSDYMSKPIHIPTLKDLLTKYLNWN